MKKILLLLVIIGAVGTVKAQRGSITIAHPDSTLTITGGKMGMSYGNIPITFWNDSTITIDGDTIQAIRLLFEELKKMSDKYYAAEAVLSQLNLRYLSEFLKSKRFTRSVKEYNTIKKKSNE